MRKFFLTAFVLAAAMVFATSVLALEKTAVRYDGDDRADSWSQDYTCSVVYYNNCTGWLYYWTGWSPGDVFGTVMDPCCQEGEIAAVMTGRAMFYNGSPAGYGFTSTMGIYDAPAGCPVPPAIAEGTFLALNWDYWTTVDFGGVQVTGPYALTIECAGAGNPIDPLSDHPAAVNPDPAQCGYCFPTSRVARSFYWGTFSSVLCPGSTFFDDVCDANLFMISDFSCGVGVEETSWGTIKNLYR